MSSLPGRASLSGLQSGAPVAGGPRLLRGVRLMVERLLPLPGAVEVQKGQPVSPDTVLATATNAPSRLHFVELTRAFDRSLGPEEVRESLLVEPGEAVELGQPLARTSRPSWFEREVQEALSPAAGVVEFISAGRGQIVVRTTSEARDERLALPVAAELALDPAELPVYATCRAGQPVAAGDMLARVRGFRPIGGEYRSPVDGVVESISPATGLITIAIETKPLVLRAFLAGWVEEVVPGYGARIAASGHRVLGVLGLGGKSWGRLICRADEQELLGQLDGPAADGASLAGAIVAVPGPVTSGGLQSCRRAGVRGVICASAHARELSGFLGRPLAAEIVTGPGTLALGHGAGSRGGEEPGFTVILTEGFGGLAMDSLTWDLLLASQGRVVSMDGLTQIRAGVVRPALLIPADDSDGPARPDADTAAKVHAAAQAAGAPGDLQRGRRVRLVRQPYFGLWGEVVEPPGGLTRLETEVEARVLSVRLDDGRLVRVAEANVEI